MDFRHVVDLVYRKIGVQYYQVHSYSLLHRYHFSQKVPRKRFVNIVSVKEKKRFRKSKTHSEVSRA
ncbi:MAG TPA: hypothetical protein VFP25_06595 [Nitrososphaeraceae archaeon]|nr:hypothetical protein [Nitrososphaeraceae archaeon]